MRLTWLGHSTVVVELDGMRVITDPVLRSRVLHLRRHGRADSDALVDLDVALVSHGHWDHLDVRSLDDLGHELPVIVPRGLGGLLRRRGFEQVIEVGVGEEVGLGPLGVKATFAEHSTSRRGRGAKSPPLGYVLTGSERVYFAGDTDLFDGMAELAPLDVALLPVGGWGPRLPPGHLDPRRAAEALRLLRPRVAVPIHYGTFSPVRRREHGSAPADAFLEAAAELAPDVEIRVLALNESARI